MLELTDVSSAKRVAGVLNAYPANPAIVLGGQVSGLAVTRSLGRRGVPVAVLDPEERALAKASRYAVASATVPSPLDGAQPALSWLGDLGRALRRPAVLLPTGDEWALAVARHGPGLGRGFVAPAAGSDVVDSILNKARLYAAALAVGMPVPRFAIINPKSLKEAEDIVGYPCVVKPSEKGDFVHRFGQAALTAESREDLLAIVDGAGDRELLLQELLPLEDAALQTAAVYVDRDGRLAASFGGRRLAVYPTGFGTSCLVESRPNQRLVDRAYRLLSHMAYRGIAEVEFIWDPSSEEWALIDVNPRCWKWVGLTGFAGVDLAWMAYTDAVGAARGSCRQVPGARWASILDLAAMGSQGGNSLLTDSDYQALLSGRGEAPIVDSVFTPDDPLPFARALESLARPGIACRC